MVAILYKFCNIALIMQSIITYYFWLFLLLLPYSMVAQQDSTFQDLPDVNQNILEDVLQNSEDDSDFDFNTAFEQLEVYLNKPLNLNKANDEDLNSLGLLNDIQIYNFLKYRNEAGSLIALEELQAIPEFDLETIQRILPYISISGDVDDYQVSIPKMMKEGTDEFFIRWSRVLQNQKGFTPLEEGQPGSRYLGDPNKLYLRYKHSYEGRLSYGFTAEKDSGEEFFKGSNKTGFDFYSAHIFLKDYRKNIKALAIGDFSASFGQGLVLYSGFGYGKSSFTTSIRRNSRVLRPYTSVNETSFLRGIGGTFAFGDQIEFTVFVSFNKRDGNALVPDTLDTESDILFFTSLQNSGLHRTPNEIADEKIIGHLSSGGSLKYKFSNGHIALNALHDRFSQTLQRNPQLYNQFYFNGDRLNNLSLDYAYVFQNFNFFGETAISDNGGWATLNGLLLGLDTKVDLAILHRHFQRDYQAIIANPFSEGSGARNESGIYLGLLFKLNRHWQLSGYFDMYRFPWLRFGVDAPSMGTDLLGRITYTRRRDMTLYMQLRYEAKDIHEPQNDTKADVLVPGELFQARLHFSKKISPAIELRSRLDVGFVNDQVNEPLRGLILYQDFIYKPKFLPFSFNTRFAVFDTDGYAVRYYAYENDLLYTFSIPAYYNEGTRFYFNLRYRPNRNLTLEARYAQTYWSNQDTFGSGLEEVNGQRRSEVKVQLRYKW